MAIKVPSKPKATKPAPKKASARRKQPAPLSSQGGTDRRAVGKRGKKAPGPPDDPFDFDASTFVDAAPSEARIAAFKHRGSQIKEALKAPGQGTDGLPSLHLNKAPTPLLCHNRARAADFLAEDAPEKKPV